MKDSDLLILISTVLRLVPYGWASVIAWRKNYRWFALAIGLSFTTAILKLIGWYGVPVQIAIASLFAFCVVIHALQLTKKGE